MVEASTSEFSASLAQVDRLDDETRSLLLTLGDDGEALCRAFSGIGRDETSAFACAMRLLRDRPTLSDVRIRARFAKKRPVEVSVGEQYSQRVLSQR